MRSITESFGSIERLVCQCGSCFVGGGGTRCRISRPCAKNREGSVDPRGRAANQGSEVPLREERGQLAAQAAPDVGRLGSDTRLYALCILPILVDPRDGAVP